MPKLRPELTEDDLRALASRAEARVYRALRDQLRPGDLVIHSPQWLYRARTGVVVEGEADFTVFRPESGFLTIEVKGGGISWDGTTGKWSSIDRRGDRHPIKDPFRQAQSERFAILDQLRGHTDWHRWPGTRVHCGHAVFFPDLEDPRSLVAPNRPTDIIGVRCDLERLDDWIDEVLQFWSDKHPTQPLGPVGIALVEQIFCRSIEVRPALAATLAQEEEVRIRLTSQQGRILRIIGGRPRAVIAGGAGTGKTLIAVEKARRLASEGKRTLMLCYNRPLADAISLAQRSVNGLEVMNFHQLCDQRIAAASRQCGHDVLSEAKEAFPGEGLFEIQMPFALGLANEILTDKYDAVIVDEAQDFSDEYWMGVEDLLRDRTSGLLYVFIDLNQAVYHRRARLPIEEEPFYLTANCRNTSFIHEAAYRYYTGEPTDPPELEGAPLTELVADRPVEQAKLIAADVRRLIGVEGLRPSDIAVLVFGRPKEEYYRLLTALPVGGGVRWVVETHPSDGVLLDTVARFKGLEAAVVLLWLPPLIDAEVDRELLYVGLSRGKSRLYLAGAQSVCTAVVTLP
jgi:hypothetical protein